ncbi:GatB/YqeY domain-containing protein [Arthrobacter caoxuetaonis]|uniref:GatB/YqeY domain-containing protein n=1 Tax=Arthrobacter caoxuetaonis TaxID=2886935 RepID=A0A9X1SEC6_9MICC|nr:GatB/YqeY domain-containing protein [Arthrobacter caoxuetaonis]MCC3299712.1 GatB/YqeY domain-containing protein [Arthrobacter caoxuetaonis]USQ59386.1 GatB/YqeY domain-containing protein [Arthrobacter caoxuetaonis]
MTFHLKSSGMAALADAVNELSKPGRIPGEPTLDRPDGGLKTKVKTMSPKEKLQADDTARIYTEAGEESRAAAEIAEAVIIEAYLPKPLERADVEKIVASVIAVLEGDGAQMNMRSMGAVMKAVTAKVAGRFDGKAVSDIVRAALS